MSTQPTYAVIDVETTMNSPIGSKSTPFHPSNRIVLRGLKRGDNSPHTADPTPLGGLGCLGRHPQVKDQIRLLVGHNIAFDIHHMRVAEDIDEEFLGTVSLWDTALAEYLLTAQRTQFASLDELVEKYGGTKKDDRVTKIFEAGLGADHVPESMLKEYLEADLLNTELVFIKQFEKAQEMGLVPLIKTQMDALMATTEMTYNGLAVNVKELMDGADLRRLELNRIEGTIVDMALEKFGYPDFNVGSTKQLSTILFGGERKYKVKEATGVTKTGKTVYRNVEKVQKYQPLFIPTGPKNKKGDYPTDDDALSKLLDGARGVVGAPTSFVAAVKEWRDKSKQLTTYWEGLLKLVMPDNRIHHSLNHTVTRTGRLSSSEPNLQNVTNGEIKKVFVSRFENGHIVEADFKQLEMVELAILSGDKTLMHDIAAGIDMHEALFLDMHGRHMRKEERKAFKRCSFCLVYGGGPQAVSEQGGVSLAEAKRFIDTFYARYPGVKDWHDRLRNVAQLKREYKGLKDEETGLPVGEYVMESEYTRRRWWFREYPTDWGTVNFSPSELKNYPVQGGATGDKVPLCVGQLYRVLRNHPTLKDKCLLINTVHDSVLFDIHPDVLHEALTVIKETMERTPEFYEEAFGYKMPLPLKVELSVGPNWLDQKEVNFSSSGVPTWAVLKEAA